MGQYWVTGKQETNSKESGIMEYAEQMGWEVTVPEAKATVDDVLVCRAKDEPRAMDQLLREMTPRALRLAKKHARSNAAQSELYQEALLLIQKAAMDFEPGRGSFEHYFNYIAARRLPATQWERLPVGTLEILSLEGLAENRWQLDGGDDKDIDCLPCLAMEDPKFRDMFGEPNTDPDELFTACIQELKPVHADILLALHDGGNCKIYSQAKGKSHAWGRKVAERARNAAREWVRAYRNELRAAA